MISKRQLYAMGEPLGDSATSYKPGGRVCGGGGSGGGGPSTSTTTNQIDARFSPLIDYATQAAAGVQNAGFTPYSGQRYADMNGTQQAGIGMIQDRAINGDPTMTQANDTLQQTLRGGNTNPYLDAMVAKAQGGVMGNMAGMQARSGSFGNSGIAEQGAAQMGKIATDMYGGAYASDRANQMQALGLAPQYGNQTYTDAAQLMKAGGQIQDQAQQQKDFNYNQFQEQQNLPYKQMAAYSGLLGSSNAGSSSTTQNSGSGGGGGK